MGWLDIRDCGGEHEGWPVALELDEERGAAACGYYVELHYPREIGRIDAIQAGCDCGWRSRRLTLSGAAVWRPSSPDLSDRDELRIRALWQAHVDGEVG